MKIIHIAPNAPYNEGWSYQENILPKYQSSLGHDVILVVTNQKHQDGKIVETNCSDCISKDGFRVVRMMCNHLKMPIMKHVLTYLEVYELLVNERPDFIFYHGLISATIFQVCKYKREVNPSCIIVQDNHLDRNIGFDPRTLKGVALKLIYTSIFMLTKKNISKVYGVTPWRVEYAQQFFGVPAKMTDVLIMGADDKKIDFTHRIEHRQSIRTKFGIDNNEFLIVTGGKIDGKKKTHLLMDAVNRLKGVKLVVFGNVLDDIKAEFEKQLSDKVQWAGFIPADEAYNYFLAADLVMFPGQHSVLWEQACACKVPCVFARWDGMEHVNNGGNATFIDDVSVEGIKRCIANLMWTDAYYTMKTVAESDKTDIYLYSNSAKKSLECARKG